MLSLFNGVQKSIHGTYLLNGNKWGTISRRQADIDLSLFLRSNLHRASERGARRGIRSNQLNRILGDATVL